MSKQKEYIIEGMSCASCAMTIENAVSKMPGVDKASVNLATEIMTVEANDQRDPEDIAKVAMVWDMALGLVGNQWKKNSKKRTKRKKRT